MWPDRVSNPGPTALESDALPTALCCLLASLDDVDLGIRVLSKISGRTKGEIWSTAS